MRDISADLRERLELAEAEANALRDAAMAAEQRVGALQEMLAAEEARFAAPARKTIIGAAIEAAMEGATKAAPPLSLDDYLLKAVRRGVHEKDELRDAAIREGYFTNVTQSPGRVVHAKLTNLVRSGALAYENALIGDRFILKEK